MSEFLIEVIFTRRQFFHVIQVILILLGVLLDVRLLAATFTVVLLEFFFFYLFCFIIGKFIIRPHRGAPGTGTYVSLSKNYTGLQARTRSLVGLIIFGATSLLTINGFYSDGFFYTEKLAQVSVMLVVGILCAIYYYRYGLLAQWNKF